MRKPLLTVTTIPLLLGALAAVQKPRPAVRPEARTGPPIHVFWEGSLAAAKARARRIGRPILVAYHRPADKGSRSMLDRVYAQPEVRSLMREFVCVVACDDAAPPIEEGPRKGKSSVFGTVTVAEHQAVATEVRARYFGEEHIALPQHLFLDADGHLIERREHAVQAEAFATLLRRILDRYDPGWQRAPAAGAKPADAGEPEAAGPGPGGGGAVPWAGLFDPDPGIRKKTVKRLLRDAGTDVVLTMFHQLGDAATKTLILEAARRGEAAGRVEALVREALGDGDPTVRAQAAVTAETYAKKELLGELRLRFAEEKDVYVRRELLRAIGASAHGDKAALLLLLKATKSRDDTMRANAYVAMALAGGQSDAVASRMGDTLIKRGLKDHDPRSRAAAVWALAELRLERAVPLIEKLIKRDRQKRRRAFYRDAIRRIGGEDVSDWSRARRNWAREKIRR